MTTTSRITNLVGPNDWKTLYKTFSQADFQSYDFETLRQTFIDYLQQYNPETFNDYVDSSEYMALLNVIAFMGQSIAYRNEMNSRESFIDTAERRDSVVKLASLVGYTPKRNTNAQGLLKVTSIKTSETITDINGYSLSGVSIIWNDPANPDWREQMNAVINAALPSSQRIGRPSASNTVLGIKTDEYTLNTPTINPQFRYTSIVDGDNMTFELVSGSVNGGAIREQDPTPQTKFTVLYRSDKLGFGSANTGYFIAFKQGTLSNYEFTIDQAVENTSIDVDIQGINESDIWLYSLDQSGNASEKWTQVDDLYSVVDSRTSYRVTSRANDQITLQFGDGTFCDTPSGSFIVYVRSSNAQKYSIEPSEMQNIQVSIPYISRSNRAEALLVSLSLTQIVNNANTRESLADIKHRAPTHYYTQHRMVNGEDYNVFPQTVFSSIVKSKAVNRASIGVSRNLDLLDPTAKYSSAKVMATDGLLYKDDSDTDTILTITDANQVSEFFSTTLKTLISSQRLTQHYHSVYPRYTPTLSGAGSYNNNATWNRSSVTSDTTTGYFYNITGVPGDFTNVPYAVGAYSSTELKYVQKNALIKFVAPSGYHFDENNFIVSGSPSATDKPCVWATVLSVSGDGFNGGLGNLSTGAGPITLSGFVPSTAIVDEIDPYLTPEISSDLIQTSITKIALGQDFYLTYDNSAAPTSEKWAITSTATQYIAKFENLGDSQYKVTTKGLTYVYASESQVRFAYSDGTVIDKSGQYLKDTIHLYASNMRQNGSQFGNQYALSVVGHVDSQLGISDDFFVEVAAYQNKLYTNPDLFGFITSETSSVYFDSVTDSDSLIRTVPINSSTVASTFTSLAEINVGKYDYPVGQIFYTGSAFYTTDANYSVTTVTTMSAKIGKDGLAFLYNHIAPANSRINPGTSNIIDMYIVTSAYLSAYTDYLLDSTGKISAPVVPSAQELSVAYGGLDAYKMASDTIAFNCVKFKPLFGPKANSALQATFKVIKPINSTVGDGDIKSSLIKYVNEYFDIAEWDFGDTFYFSELSAYLHAKMGTMVGSIVLEPVSGTFGDLYEIKSAPNEIFVNAATTDNVKIITTLSGSLTR